MAPSSHPCKSHHPSAALLTPQQRSAARLTSLRVRPCPSPPQDPLSSKRTFVGLGLTRAEKKRVNVGFVETIVYCDPGDGVRRWLPFILVVATRDVEAGEWALANYGVGYWQSARENTGNARKRLVAFYPPGERVWR